MTLEMYKLHNLFAANRHRGSFRVAATETAATVYLYDMIVDNDVVAEWVGGVSPGAFSRELRGITAPLIHLRVNSPGGSVFAARAIEQAIREHKSKIVAHVDGVAASAASFLIMAADEIVMSPGSFLMIHKATACTCGNADDLLQTAALLEQVDGTLIKTYAKRSGQDEAQIADWLAAETWIEASKAVDLGFADAVADDTSPQASWDLSAYSSAPAALHAALQKEAAPPPVDRDALRRAALAAIIPA